MKVEFYANLRELTGCSVIDAPLTPTINGLINLLCERYGKNLAEKLLTSQGELGPEIIIMINGRHIVHLGGINAPLKENDLVQILPMIEGG